MAPTRERCLDVKRQHSGGCILEISPQCNGGCPTTPISQSRRSTREFITKLTSGGNFITQATTPVCASRDVLTKLEAPWTFLDIAVTFGLIRAGRMEITKLIGETGLFQNIMLVIAMYRGVMLAINNLGGSFLLTDVDHWCARPPNLMESISAADWKSLAIPPTLSGKTHERCVQYNFTMSEPGVSIVINKETPLIPCTFGYEYDTTEFWPSGTELWDLVCKDKWMRSIPQSALMAGMTIGFLAVGHLSDIYGRRPLLLGSMIAFVVLELCSAFAPFFWVFCILRFLSAISITGINNSITIYVETVGADYRSRTMLAYGVCWGLGIALLALLAAVVPQWNYQLILYAFMYTAPLLLWRYVQESPKWLIASGQIGEAATTIRKIRRMNRLNDPSDPDDTAVHKALASYALHHEVPTPQKAKHAFEGLFHSRRMRKFMLTNVVLQFLVAIVRYDLSLSTRIFPMDPYSNYAVGAVSEIVSGFTSMASVRWLPRKPTTIICLAISCVAYILMIFVPHEHKWVSAGLMFCCRILVSNAYNINIVYLSEIFPTNIRGLAIGITQTVYSIGSAVEPFLDPVLKNPTHNALFGSVALFISTLMIIPWPETRGAPLPDTIEEEEEGAETETAKHPL